MNKILKIKSKIGFRLTIISIGFLLLLLALIGSPISKSPISLHPINLGKSPGLVLPTDSLSASLSVNRCPDNLSYSDQNNYTASLAGLKVFRIRLLNELRNSNNSFNSLATKSFQNISSQQQSKTCLLPLSIRIDYNQGVEIPDSALSEIALGQQSIFCSGSKAYFSENTRFFLASDAIANYSAYIKQKQIISELNRKLKKQKALITRSRGSQTKRVQKEIRRLTLSINYAKYHQKGSSILADFFNHICSRVNLPVTPNQKDSETLNKTAIPTVIASPASMLTNTPSASFTAATKTPSISPAATRTTAPTIYATKTAVIPTAVNTKTATATSTKTASAVASSTPALNLCSSGLAQSITQHEITWDFDKAYPCGQFVNGDYWVLGPVKINKITPALAGGRNGSMINPSAAGVQGFDYLAHGYNAALSTVVPVNISSNASVVSTVARPDCDPPKKCRPALKTAAILTVLMQRPANNGQNLFRPPYAGTNKILFSADQLQTSLLPAKSSPSNSVPTLAEIERNFKRPWLDFQGEWTGAFIHPTQNMPEYGSELANATNSGALRLMLNDSISAKRAALINYIQYGIDLYGNLALNPMYAANGGHMHGRILPLVFAATLLNSDEIRQAILNRGLENFQEDGSVVISPVNGKALFGQARTGGEFEYWQNQMIDRNTRTAPDPYGYIDGGLLPGGYYHSCCTSSNYKGTALALKLMPKLREIWPANKFISYSERWVREGTVAAPDPCASPTVYNRRLISTDPKHISLWNTLNLEPDESKRLTSIWNNRAAFGYGTLFGPDGKGSCIKGSGRFIGRHGIEKDGGGYQNPFVNELWKLHGQF